MQIIHVQHNRITTTLANGAVMDAIGLNERGMVYSPVMTITDPKAKILGTVTVSGGRKLPSYAQMKNADGTTAYLCNAPVISPDEMRRIAKEAGVHCYYEGDKGVVFANNSMISFHTATPGQYTLHAKTPVKWTMVYPEKRAIDGVQADLTFTAPQPDTYIFTIE